VPDIEGSLLAEVNLAEAEPRFLSRLQTWLCDPLDGCTPGVIREAGIVLGELVANAFRHATPPYRVRLVMKRRGHLIRLSVTDGAPAPADGWPPARGLVIVRGMCPRWGVEPHGVAGKTVWAELPVLVPPSAAHA
jgi:hypothetical protein